MYVVHGVGGYVPVLVYRYGVSVCCDVMVVVEEVFKSFTCVKVKMPQCTNISSQIKVLLSKCLLSVKFN